MKTWKTGLTALSILLTSVAPKLAFAGGSDGGGGGAMVCYEKDGKTIKYSEILDIWEAKYRPHLWEKPAPYAYKLDIPYSNEPVQRQIDRAMAKLQRLDPLFYSLVKKNLDYVMDKKNHEDLPRNQKIEVPSDALNVYGEEGCEVKGMLYFDGETMKLSKKKEIFSKSRNNTIVAASYTHEAIWKTVRDLKQGFGDSTSSRRINACLYSKNDCFGLADLKKEIQRGAPATVYKCKSDQREFTLIEDFRRVEQRARGQLGLKTRLSIVSHQLGSNYFPVPLIVTVDNLRATSGYDDLVTIDRKESKVGGIQGEEDDSKYLAMIDIFMFTSPVLRHYLLGATVNHTGSRGSYATTIVYDRDLTKIVGLKLYSTEIRATGEILPDETASCERVN